MSEKTQSGLAASGDLAEGQESSTAISSNLIQGEQAFLREQLADRYFIRTSGVDPKLQDSVIDYRKLFDDLVGTLSFLEERDRYSTRGSDSAHKDAFNKTLEGREYILSLRTLTAFFKDKRKKLNAGTINSIYFYISDSKITREEFLREQQGCYYQVSQPLVDKLLADVLTRYDRETQSNSAADFYKHLYKEILQKVDRGLPFITFSKQRLVSFFEGGHRKTVSLATLNTLVYYATENKLSYREYRKDLDLTESIGDESANRTEKEILADTAAIPIIAFVFSLVLAFIYYFLRDNYEFLKSLHGLKTTIIALCTISGVWFTVLYFQARDDFRRGKPLSDFWTWWYDAPPVTSIIDKTSVSVLLVHDNSFTVRADLAKIRANFKILRIEEIRVGNCSEEEFITKCSALKYDGIYLMYTKNLPSWVTKAVLLVANQREDLPIVYVDYLGTHSLHYGRVDPTDASIGLWQLLLQSLRRVSTWQRQVRVMRKYMLRRGLVFSSVLLAILLTTCLENSSGLSREIKIDEQSVELNEASKESLAAHNSHVENTFLVWLRSNNLPRENYNMSYFVRDSAQAVQWYRTDENQDHVIFRLGNNRKGLVTNSFRPNCEKVVALPSEKNDTTVQMKIYHFSRNEVLQEVEDATWATDVDEERKDEFTGMMCVRVGRVSTCLEAVFDNSDPSLFRSNKGVETAEMLEATSRVLDKLLNGVLLLQPDKKNYKRY